MWSLRDCEALLAARQCQMKCMCELVLYKDQVEGQWRDGRRRLRPGIMTSEFREYLSASPLPADYVLVENKGMLLVLDWKGSFAPWVMKLRM